MGLEAGQLEGAAVYSSWVLNLVPWEPELPWSNSKLFVKAVPPGPRDPQSLNSLMFHYLYHSHDQL